MDNQGDGSCGGRKAYQLKTELKGTKIWRRVIIPAGATFYRLFYTIQRSISKNLHLPVEKGQQGILKRESPVRTLSDRGQVNPGNRSGPNHSSWW